MGQAAHESERRLETKLIPSSTTFFMVNLETQQMSERNGGGGRVAGRGRGQERRRRNMERKKEKREEERELKNERNLIW